MDLLRQGMRYDAVRESGVEDEFVTLFARLLIGHRRHLLAIGGWAMTIFARKLHLALGTFQVRLQMHCVGELHCGAISLPRS